MTILKSDELSSYAPILVFIYNRPHHLEQTLNSLIECDGFENHQVIVVGDGPKDPRGMDRILQARGVAKRILGPTAIYEFATTNKGLAKSIIQGVTKFIRIYQKVIVVEDDLLLHKKFLRYMNDALNFYEDNESVFSVSGYAYKEMDKSSGNKPLFLPCISTWGWGTWENAWDHFDSSSKGIEQLAHNSDTRARFNINNAYPFADMLEAEKAGEVESWGVRWYWTLFCLNKVCCFPRNSLVINDGYDSEGTNGRGWAGNFRKKTHFTDSISPTVFSQTNVAVDDSYYQSVSKALFKLNGSYLGCFKDKIRKIARRIARLL